MLCRRWGAARRELTGEWRAGKQTPTEGPAGAGVWYSSHLHVFSLACASCTLSLLLLLRQPQACIRDLGRRLDSRECGAVSEGKRIWAGQCPDPVPSHHPTDRLLLCLHQGRGKPPSKFKSIVESTIPSRPNGLGGESSVQLPRRYIAFKVERQVGAMVRQRPDKSSPRCPLPRLPTYLPTYIPDPFLSFSPSLFVCRVKTLLQNTKVFVYGKR